jgi:glycosyltransferase involved in cell wall biosynthesis
MPHWGKFRFFQWGLWLKKYLAKIEPDILHAHQIPAAGWMGAVANYHPFVISGWGSDILVEPHKSLFRRLLVKFVLRRTDYLTVPSQIMHKEALKFGYPQQRLSLIPWGVETDVFYAKPDDRFTERALFGFDRNQKIILFPRRVASIYNLDILISAYKEILEESKNLKLVLLRFHPDEACLAKIEQQIQAYGLDDHIVWLPACNSPDEMAKLYRISDIVISIPSSEGYGFSVYEAMACGTPTIITDLPVFEDELVHLQDTLKVPVRDVQETKRALTDLLSNHTLYQTIVNNGLQAVVNKSIGNRIRQVDNLYQHIMNQRN